MPTHTPAERKKRRKKPNPGLTTANIRGEPRGMSVGGRFKVQAGPDKTRVRNRILRKRKKTGLRNRGK